MVPFLVLSKFYRKTVQELLYFTIAYKKGQLNLTSYVNKYWIREKLRHTSI
jgi:hypothetical protein